MTGRQRSGWWLAAVLACAGSGSAGAAEPDAATLDRQLQGLKADTLALGVALRDFETAQSYPAGGRASIYVSVGVPGFLLDSLALKVDGKDAAAHRYTGGEARALQKLGWHRAQEMALEPGTHQLRADFEGHYWNAPEGEPHITGKLEASFDKGATDLDLALPLSRAHLHDTPVLSPLKVVDAREVQAGDLKYHSALFLKNDGRYLSALTELGAGAADTAQLPASHQALLAACYVGFGMEDAAQKIDRQLAARSADPRLTARGRLDLARLEYDRGSPEASVQSLQEMRDGLPDSLRDEWRTALAEALLAQDRYRDTATLLGGSDPGAATALSPGQRFNLAVALIKDGRVEDGRHQLELVGTLDATDGDSLALRDKANLTLGYQYLQAQNGSTARVAFARVRSRGPYSNQALLGRGWAEVAPDTGGAAGADQKTALQAATVPWAELIKRDPMDPAVEEGFLALAWSLEQQHSDEQSIAYYTHAIEALELARTRMQDARKAVRSGQMVNTMVAGDPDSERGWTWRAVNLADTPETYFLQRLLAQNRFQEVLKDYRDALVLEHALAAWQARLPAPAAADASRDLRDRIQGLTPRIAANRVAQNRLLEALALQELDGQQQQIEHYLTESRLAVARLYERQLGEGR